MATPSNVDRTNGSEGSEIEPVEDHNEDVLKDFIQVVQSVIPLLDQMKSSIEESTNRIPRASVQLNNVTRATELATVEILNVLDSITKRIGEVEAILHHLARSNEQLQAIGTRISELLGHVRNSDTAGISELHSLWTQYFKLAPGSDLLGAANKAIDETRKDTLSIVMALQVQDITSQQIAGVVHLIESVRAQLRLALKNLDGESPADAALPDATIQRSTSTPSSFDIDATFTQSPERQDLADDVISKWKSSTQQPSK